MSDEEASILKISNIQLSDKGNYTCIAKSSQSEARTTASLNVEGTRAPSHCRVPALSELGPSEGTHRFHR